MLRVLIENSHRIIMVVLKVPWHIICSRGCGNFSHFPFKDAFVKNYLQNSKSFPDRCEVERGNPNINPYIIRHALGIVKLDDEGVSMVTLAFPGFRNSTGSVTM